jgi:hypothetical protein
MTVQINIEQAEWVEAVALADELHLDRDELLLRAFRSCLNDMRRERQKRMTVAEKEEQHRESYEKYPVQPDEFSIDEEQLAEVWKDL